MVIEDTSTKHGGDPLSTLPVHLSGFVGRMREVRDVANLVEHRRLVTLVGAPGVGKTRLAIRVANDLGRRFADGVWFVELAGLSEPALVTDAVAATLGVQAQPTRSLRAALAAYLGAREALLVLDNCEHLVFACASLVEELLRRAPALRILSTSREPLRAEGETSWRVPSLSVPTTDFGVTDGNYQVSELAVHESVQLFVDRASAALPSFSLTEQNAASVARVCRLLDGIPLAIELAAARVGTLTTEHIATWLEDRLGVPGGGRRTALPRQRTLGGAIDWSHNLLSDDERVVFRRLSVFAGGWPLEAAEVVCEDHRDAGRERDPVGPPAADVPAIVLQLVDKSLVQADVGAGAEARYRMLEIVRHYGLDRLRETGEVATVRRRHLRWCVDLAERGRIGLLGADARTWLPRLADERDNVRAALAWSLSEPNRAGVSVGLRLAGALFFFWLQRDDLAEGLYWLQRVLEADREARGSGDSSTDPAGEGYGPAARTGAFGSNPRVAALVSLAALLQHQQDAETMHAIKDALALARQSEDRLGAAHALVALAIAHGTRGEPGRAARLLEESLSIFRGIGDHFGIWRALSNLGEWLVHEGDTGRARAVLEEALAVARAMGYAWGAAQASRMLGVRAYRERDLVAAAALLSESLATYRALGATRGPHNTLCELGQVVLELGDPRRAAAFFLEALSLVSAAGDRRTTARALEGLAGTVPERGGSAPKTCLESAARILGYAAASREAIDRPVPLVDRPALERTLTMVRSGMGGAAFEAALADGRALAPSRAVALGLELGRQLAGDSTITPSDATPDPPPGNGPTGAPLLTARERQVAVLVARGLSNRQIATRLVISERTVHGHVANILAKLEFRSRARIAAWVVQQGLSPETTR